MNNGCILWCQSWNLCVFEGVCVCVSECLSLFDSVCVGVYLCVCVCHGVLTLASPTRQRQHVYIPSTAIWLADREQFTSTTSHSLLNFRPIVRVSFRRVLVLYQRWKGRADNRLIVLEKLKLRMWLCGWWRRFESEGSSQSWNVLCSPCYTTELHLFALTIQPEHHGQREGNWAGRRSATFRRQGTQNSGELWYQHVRWCCRSGRS